MLTGDVQRLWHEFKKDPKGFIDKADSRDLKLIKSMFSELFMVKKMMVDRTSDFVVEKMVINPTLDRNLIFETLKKAKKI